jgi:broad specificity phosphatase PhoE
MGMQPERRVTSFYFIRHAATDFVGKSISGRMPGVHINELGRKQAAQLAKRLGAQAIEAIYCSPQTRARETAEPLAIATGQEIVTAAALDELNFGAWTGRTYDELRELPDWRRFNSARSTTRIPHGELMLEVQSRAIGFVECIAGTHVRGSVVLVSHGDVIRAALAFYLGMPLEFLLRFEVSPASVSVVTLETGNPRVMCVNSMEG